MQHIILFLAFIAVNSLFAQSFKSPYDLSEPAAVYDLPEELNEVSGIRLIDDQRMVCIQDELGEIFIYNLTSRSVTDRIPFGKDNDYEDVVVLNDDAFVLESDGDIHIVRNFLDAEKRTVDKKETALEQENNCEGLCYQASTHSLLIACKGRAGLDKDRDLDDYRAVYRFSIKDEELFEAPVMLVNINDLLDYSNLNIFARLSYKLASRMDPNGDIRFQPSAIDIHPISGYIYITSFVGSLMAIYDENGYLLAAERLDRLIFMQPEGLDFDEEGNMYISNESNGGQANILLFEYQETN